MRIDVRDLATTAGSRRVLIVTPMSHIRVGRARLEQLRGRVGMSEVDDEMLAEIRRHAPIHGFVMRGSSADGHGSWQLDDALSDPERIELVRLMFRAHMPLKRVLFAAGCFDTLHIGWRDVEIDAFTRAAARLRDELVGACNDHPVDTVEGKLARLDLWIVERLTFYHSMTLHDVLEEILPRRLDLREERRPHTEALLSALPANALVPDQPSGS